MPIVDRVTFDLVDEGGAPLGRAAIAVLPSMTECMGLPALVDERGQSTNSDLEPVQLVEGFEYLFEVTGAGAVFIDKGELFIADDGSGRRGRLRTRLSTGRVEVNVTLDGKPARPFAFEVRSTKLDYLDDYRWMLEDVAELGTELVLERFAPSEQRLEVEDTRDSRTLYQRFVFLRGLLEGERLGAALRKIVAEPYVQWEREEHALPPSRGLRGGGRVARQLTGPGPRSPWAHAPLPALATLPQRVQVLRTEETVDNIPNRFVLHALREWRGIVAELLTVLEADRSRTAPNTPAPVSRGLREAESLASFLDGVVRSPVFLDVGLLGAFPLANQVLQRREGYREVHHAYLLVQLGASLAWAGGEDVFGGGLRNVATLYEYWVFLELAKIVSDLCDEKLDLNALVQDGATGLQLVLRRQKAHAVRGVFERLGRRFHVELCFNHHFDPGPNGTWTRTLRPDCSLHIIPADSSHRDDDVWLHFDAKYRVERLEELVGGTEEPALVAKAEDLYKMHTYRDAIVRAVGAYVVFPGSQQLTRGLYDEVLPGLGAFPLRPARGGSSTGSDAIRKFLRDVFVHVATQTTKHERERYWRRRSRSEFGSARPVRAVDFLERPPADTQILLGYVKSPDHHEWIVREALYNLRADPNRDGALGVRSPELGAELLLLYGATSDLPVLFRVEEEVKLAHATELAQKGYPDPNGRMYFCLQVIPIDPPPWLTAGAVSAIAAAHRSQQAFGAPLSLTWRDVVEFVAAGAG